jgi:pectate lyase
VYSALKHAPFKYFICKFGKLIGMNNPACFQRAVNIFLLKDNCKVLKNNNLIQLTHLIPGIVLLLLLPFGLLCQERVYSDNNEVFNLVGFATLNGGTNGGEGGMEVEVSSFNDLKLYAEEENTPYIIKINGIITGTGSVAGGDYDGRIRVASNKSIIGIGSDAFLDGVGLTISDKSNIIIRNIKISLISIADSIPEGSHDIPGIYSEFGDEGRAQILVNGGDLISIYGESHNIWIDHCELYSEDTTIQPNKDLYDGIIDIRNQSAYITISWNYIHDHWKAHLIGSSTSDDYDRKTTFHHNYWERCNTRLPMYRFGNGHIFNNYYDSIYSSGISCKEGACIRIEGNYFENSKDPIGSFYSGGEGFYDVNDNDFFNCTGNQPTASNCTFDPPYSYNLDPAAQIKSIVMEGAGVGKLDNSNSIISKQDLRLNLKIYPNPATEYLNIQGEKGYIIKVYSSIGVLLNTFILQNEETKVDLHNIEKGVYIIEIRNENLTTVRKVIVE